MDKQKTIKKESVLKGVGLHTGSRVNICLKPAVENEGISFVRTDLAHRPRIKACLENIRSEEPLPRCTTLGQGEEAIHTVEHLMAALAGLGIDNLTVEIDGNELPGMDGSSLDFLKAIKKSGIKEQDTSREYFVVREPIVVVRQESSIAVVPDDDFRIAYTLHYDHPFLQTQYFSAKITPDFFAEQIAPCRTFCLESEAKDLRSKNLGMGANHQNTLVVGKRGVIDNQTRFKDEFTRHKVLDFIGDLYLLGKPIRGQVFATRSGHRLNIELLKKIAAQDDRHKTRNFVPQFDYGADHRQLDIQQILKVLPHRYPFLLVDRIVHLEPGKRAVGIKNVTINDNFFSGHFPTRPVMPGVLMVEALAQTGGVLVLANPEHEGKVALFNAAHHVKFRRLVVPGDQLHLEVELLRDRPGSAFLKGVAKVDGEVVVEAEILFSFTNADFLG